MSVTAAAERIAVVATYRIPERPPFFSLPTNRLSLLRTAERVRMPEAALLTFFVFFTKITFSKSFLLPLASKLLLFGILRTTWTPLSFVTLLAEWSSFL